jgi:tetratricopeptide (TPR) repeat protein
MKIQFVTRDPNSIFYKVFIIIFLIAVTLSVYWQVKDHQFINFDDDYYVTSNSHILTGLNIENIKWAFFSTYASNWHPITWISHMIDIKYFGMNPGMHHLVNVTFHILNTILLFIILNKMTGAMWRSAFVSALFALHPMHVESVAWISERKDVLSTLFWMLTMLAYYSYTRNRNVSRYMLTILFFGIGLMSKPMMVTLPFALLLLDFWPLNREGLISPAQDNGAICDTINIKVLFKLIIEKIPLIVLTLFACGITFYAQSTSGSVASTSFAFRIQNVIISYVIYLWKLIWPLKLAVFYPYPREFNMLMVLICLLFLITVTSIILIYARKLPFLATGWFWYLGTLVPVIGFVKVGDQSMADRYTYIPYIGIFIIVAWGIPDLISRMSQKKFILPGSIIIVLTVLSLRTWFQIAYWKDDVSLFSHCLEVNSDNYVALVHLAGGFVEQGKSEKAIYYFQKELSIHPTDPFALNGLGRLYNKLGQYDKSIQLYTKEIRYYPKDVNPNFDLGTIYAAKGDLDKAIKQFSYVVKLDPKYALAYYNLGTISLQKQEINKAIEYCTSALRLNYNDKDSHCLLGVALMKQERIDDAISHFSEALRIDPHFKEARDYLASAVLIKKVDENIVRLEQDKVIEPNNPDVLQKLAVIYARKGENSKALDNLYNLAKIQPNNPNGYYNIACVYAKEGNVNLSVEWLKKSIDKGFKDWDLLKKDKDLDNIRNTAFINELIKNH